ncbi:hypothetical protein CLAFUW4_09180 [Fulvia fulva]|uniref:Uncharacterized protein n=1 Tax=Passalora fulva TaxID=5499 RepID=A0A9Q8UTQ6_PASFU|nr:uncharacterized protein CLAFUR5_09280 [Fulvia fulva]KAK4613985.1 hypothetical protein CLAFUR4_09186 [Fulvia fulva]KAK4615010.1 hypothetical protein CLAFUR0_09178 [Fulvia fulva]UJO22032.1 hypothetical protein CLAFUR5_09280 [Fulvia fulva]WPV20210.1 hypothetical protein CLAFUW4_09180 [Fulvia fulva]WPV35060.1 hypothetical protein CLAFUW7_09181 [Fulvia fulva]
MTPIQSLIKPAEIVSTGSERGELYDRCSLEELQSFVKVRGGKDVKMPTTYEGAGDWLLAKDQHDTFRYLDLPPELRLIVNEELLAYDPKRPSKILHSQLLSTSKQINNECSDILQKTIAEGGIHIIRIRTNESDTPYCYATCYTSERCAKCRHVISSTTIQFRNAAPIQLQDIGLLHNDLTAMPPIAESVTRMTIDIVFEGPCVARGLEAIVQPVYNINRQLYLLATQIPSSNITAVSVRVTVPEKVEIEKKNIASMLWPLTKLGPEVEVNITGVPDDVVEYLASQQNLSSHKTTALTAWPEIKAKADDLVQRVQKAGIKHTGVQFLPRLLAAAFRNSDTERYEFDSYSDSRSGGHVTARIVSAMTI